MCRLAFKELAFEITMEMVSDARKQGYDFRDLADHLDCSEFTVRKYFYGEKTPSFPVFIGMFKKVKPVNVLRKFAGYCGYAVVKLPEVKANLKNISIHTSKVMKETADVITSVAKALEDQEIKDFEKKDISTEINEAIEALLKLRAYMEV